jgi:hypothetical protein
VFWIYENNFIHQRLQNTVIEKKSITVHYPHHPYYGKSLPIVEIHQKGNPPGYICKVSVNATVFIPKWVTYPEAEQGSMIQPAAQLDFETLLKLSRYLNQIDMP